VSQLGSHGVGSPRVRLKMSESNPAHFMVS